MRLIKKYLDRGSSGELKLEPEEQEDMWHAYNLIAVGDSLRSSTVRKVVQTSDTGSSTTAKKRMTLTIEVIDVYYDSAACALRVKGRTIEENDFVKKGSYHTLDLELHSAFTLRKHEWDSIALDRVEMACNPAHQADVAAVIMHEGLANVCLITEHLTINRQKIEHTIPRKRKGLCAQHDKGMERFYDVIIAAIIKHIDFTVVKAVIIASPGFIKDQFYQYMLAKAVRDDEKHLLENPNKFILLHSSNGFKHALSEILQDPLVLNRLSDSKAAGEMKLFDQFMHLLNDEPEKAYYGLEVVEKANQAQAIECLLITDELFQNIDFTKRRRYVQLVDSVKESGGDVRLFSRKICDNIFVVAHLEQLKEEITRQLLSAKEAITKPDPDQLLVEKYEIKLLESQIVNLLIKYSQYVEQDRINQSIRSVGARTNANPGAIGVVDEHINQTIDNVVATIVNKTE